MVEHKGIEPFWYSVCKTDDHSLQSHTPFGCSNPTSPCYNDIGQLFASLCCCNQHDLNCFLHGYNILQGSLLSPMYKKINCSGGYDRTWTRNLLIKSQLLYQLSYIPILKQLRQDSNSHSQIRLADPIRLSHLPNFDLRKLQFSKTCRCRSQSWCKWGDSNSWQSAYQTDLLTNWNTLAFSKYIIMVVAVGFEPTPLTHLCQPSRFPFYFPLSIISI